MNFVASVWLVVQALKEAVAPSGFLPVTAVGWLTTIGLVIGFALQFVAMGRFLEKLNGLGGRLTDHVDATTPVLAAIQAREHQTALILERLTTSSEHLLRDVTAATVMVEACNDNDTAIERTILRRLDDAQRENSQNAIKVAERLASLETATKLTVDLRKEARG